MKLASIVGMVVGLAVLVWLIAWQGVADVALLLAASGWSLLWVPVIWLPTLFMNARAWQVLFPPEHMPRFRPAFMAQWMGRAVNTLLPVASIGGEVVKARVLILHGLDAKHTSAATVVDKTVQVVTTVLWGIVGICLLAWVATGNPLVISTLVGVVVLSLGAGGFIFVQRAGLFGFAAASARRFSGSALVERLAGAAQAIDALILDTYGRRGALARATAWRMAALILQAAEVWLAALLLGYPISIFEALLLKSLTSTISDVAFVIPNSYGVQEGAFVVLGAVVGMPADIALALSLVIRIRELVIDVPGLVLWQHAEGRALFKRRRNTIL